MSNANPTAASTRMSQCVSVSLTGGGRTARGGVRTLQAPGGSLRRLRLGNGVGAASGTDSLVLGGLVLGRVGPVLPVADGLAPGVHRPDVGPGALVPGAPGVILERLAP